MEVPSEAEATFTPVESSVSYPGTNHRPHVGLQVIYFSLVTAKHAEHAGQGSALFVLQI